RTAVGQNLGVQVTRYGYREAGESLREAYGPFASFTPADIAHSNKETPVSSQSTASASRNTFVNLGVSQLLPTGGTYSVDFNNNRLVQSGGFTTVSPAFGSSLSLGLQQPLLRNFGMDINRRQITIARNTLGLNGEELPRTHMHT